MEGGKWILKFILLWYKEITAAYRTTFFLQIHANIPFPPALPLPAEQEMEFFDSNLTKDSGLLLHAQFPYLPLHAVPEM